MFESRYVFWRTEQREVEKTNRIGRLLKNLGSNGRELSKPCSNPFIEEADRAVGVAGYNHHKIFLKIEPRYIIITGS